MKQIGPDASYLSFVLIDDSLKFIQVHLTTKNCMLGVLLVLLQRPQRILYGIKLDLLWPERTNIEQKTYKNQKLHNPQLQIATKITTHP